MTLPRILRGIAVLAVITAAVIGFIDAFSSNPLTSYTWAVPTMIALIAAGLALIWMADHFIRS
jgi:hypothetical protein